MTEAGNDVTPAPAKKGAGGFLRTLSILAAIATALVIVLYPRAVAHDAAGVPHGPLEGMLLGMSILWVHGFGFTPEHRILRIVLHPLVGWALLLGCGAAVFLPH
ncbi:cyd operon YbgE family protein [Sutterella sp.]|uniref:cyd operon YbgE family protein n=1 Tax=Sutterella sp. TaxID=1981025 RepID=UPI0026E01DC4|nr:cyd operon YbgE family protein [Sutterella sp.]MDO5530476.1 cyd operon YbgE family protein [Sutterella sp.]